MAPGLHTSRKHPSHPIYPYLLRDREVTQPNEVWATDITYIPFRKRFFYLIAIQDWYSRKILSWRLSPTLDLSFCLDALREALATYGTPEIFNTDQGSDFTASDWVDMLTEHGVTISMDGKGRALDNVFMERFWRSLKYEYVFLHPLEDGAALKAGLHTYITWYNQRRPH
jgi:putative transposase